MSVDEQADDGAGPGRLVELAVTDLGIIEHARLVFGPAMTALTGETGAGKTLLVGAIELLLGGRADAAVVRPGATEAVVEGRFAMGDDDLILTRVIPVEGRSRAYVDGRLATAGALAERAGELVDLHGQHAHQSLLSPATQRAALDRFAGVDLGPLLVARAEQRRIAQALDALGGDAGARAREADLLRFQLDELGAAAITDPDEDERLTSEEGRLADTEALRQAAGEAAGLIGADGAAGDHLAKAVTALGGRQPFAEAEARLRSMQAELADVAAEVRRIGEEAVDDPDRLAAIRSRRQLLAELRRKYASATTTTTTTTTATTTSPGSVTGETARRRAATLADVMAFEAATASRLAEIESHDERCAQLDTEAEAAAVDERAAGAAVGAARRAAAPALAEAVESHLHELAMPKARLVVNVGDQDPGDEVALLLAANPGAEPAPLAKVASGGELARAMLALRLVLSTAPPVLVFDEVDAGIGGQAALAVGQALAALGADHQVLVVTHLPQVAAFAHDQVHVVKADRNGATVASVATLDRQARVLELSRMLSGTPDNERVQGAAEELLAMADGQRPS